MFDLFVIRYVRVQIGMSILHVAYEVSWCFLIEFQKHTSVASMIRFTWLTDVISKHINVWCIKNTIEGNQNDLDELVHFKYIKRSFNS